MAALRDTAKGSNDVTGTVLATTDALAVTAGDLIVLCAKCEGATTTVTGSDAQGNTYSVGNTLLEHSNGDLSGATLFAVASATGTITPTATYGGSRPFRIVSAYSISLGAGKTGWALDAVNAAQGNSSTAVSAGAASATDSGVAIASFHLYGTRVLTAGAGWSIPAEFSSSAAQVSEYRLPTGAGSITGDGTLSSVQDWVAQLLIVRETAGGTTHNLGGNATGQAAASGGLAGNTQNLAGGATGGGAASGNVAKTDTLGAAATGGGSATGNVAKTDVLGGAATGGGSATATLQGGATLTSQALKNPSGGLLAAATIDKVVAIRLSDLSILNLGAQVTNGAGLLVVFNAGLVAGQAYLLVTSSNDGSACGVRAYTAA